MQSKFVKESISFERGKDPKEVLGIGPNPNETFIVQSLYYGCPYKESSYKNMILTKQKTHEEIQYLIDEAKKLDPSLNISVKILFFYGKKHDEISNGYYTIDYLIRKFKYKWAKYNNEYYIL